MVAKAILLILTTLYGCHSWNYDEQNCSTNKIFVNLKCLDSKQHSINIFLVDQTLHITHDNGLVDIDLETFPKLDISHELRKANRKLIRIKMENCTLPNGHSFGILFEHLGIEDEILAFEGVNIARSSFLIDGRFSGGFEKVENLTLSGNSIRQLDEHVFQSLPKLFNLDLSHNEIVTVHKNVFKNMTELKQLKLSWNRLKSLSEGMFDHQKHLNVLSLHSNRLSYLTKDMFQGLDCLNVLTLEKNEFSGLTSDVFHNLPALLQISLGNSNMRVPYTIFAKQSHLQYVFLEKVNVNEGLHLSGLLMLQIKSSEVSSISGLSNIEKLSIISCKLNPSAITSFKNFSSTKELNLSSNKISNLENGLFDGMRELVQLQLSNNYLTNISRLDFQDLHNLNEIDLSDNRITTIHPKAFVNTTQLTTINLKNNQLWFNDSKTPFLHLYNLETLNLSNNSLERMPADLLNLEKLKEVDLSFNQIRLVKFSEIRPNFIKLNATYETRPSLGNRNTHINLKNNPLDCDCSMFEFLSGTDQGQLAPVFSDTCFKHAHHLRPCYRETYLSDECPTGCDCTEDKVNQFGIQISCKGNGLTRLPGIELIHATPFELDISNNSLTELPCLHTNAHVTFIQASFNRISQIEVDKLPGSLRGLDLSHNNIKTIAPYVIAYLQHHRSLEIILLKDNPFECRCSDDTEQLVKFASENGSITDFHEANCNENYALTADVLRDICDQEKTIYILSFLTVLTIISGLILILLFKHRKFIKIWLYANDWFLWWVDEEYVDRDKVYDIFISYADENKMLAYRITVALERSNVFRICLHERDFLGGERIEKSIHDAVYQSRRTLVILSESYVTSQWCEHEFHLAWARSVSERRNLIIALKAGELENIADETIDSYIKSHTYIDANDQWFWERLIYRLPHKKTIKNILPIREYEIVEYEESENEEESV